MIGGKRRTIGVFMCKAYLMFDSAVFRRLEEEAKRLNYDIVIFTTVGYFESQNDYDSQELGMFAFALVVTALAGFAIYIAKSLKMQNSIRTGASTQTDSVEFSTFGAKYVFGAEKLNIRESVTMPSRAIVVGE